MRLSKFVMCLSRTSITFHHHQQYMRTDTQYFFAKIYYFIPADYDKAKAHELACKRRCRQHQNYLDGVWILLCVHRMRVTSRRARTLDNASPQSKQGASESVHFYHLPDTLHRKPRARITFLCFVNTQFDCD